MTQSISVGCDPKVIEVNKEYSKIRLDTARKQNELLGLEVEMQKIALERNNVALQLEKREFDKWDVQKRI